MIRVCVTRCAPLVRPGFWVRRLRRSVLVHLWRTQIHLMLLSACKVYLPQCEPGTEEPERAHPGGGVTVKLSELDGDGGEP